ncbi:ABC transporter involved in cytochrome c biogenesis permease [Flammeovirgaceae bacterium 311]|nr:ABC transporter involved in cytochrome c biogenesis permease [Flammeovirgaceae bacterium 311]
MPIFRILLSTKTTLVLIIAFAVAMAVATFIENDHGTEVARVLVYEAWWFELIMIWMAINFISHIPRYKLFTASRWPVGLFHVAFVAIILGAGVTRYFSTEGVVHIREGSSENTFYTTAHYLQVLQLGEHSGKRFEKPLQLISKGFEARSFEVDFEDQKFSLSFLEFIKGAREEFADGKKTFLDFAVTQGTGREDFLINKGEDLNLGTLSIGTDAAAKSPIKIYKKDSSWIIQSDRHLQVMDMSTQQMGVVHAGETQPLKLRSLYQWKEGAFLVKAIHENKEVAYVAETDEALAENLTDAVKIEVRDLQNKLVTESYIRLVKIEPAWHSFEYAGKTYSLTYGPKVESLPFALQLKAFELERYPGSQSPASYASEMMVLDGQERFPYRIFMNNVLDHKGFRFYQSSYDTDEKGTVLAVSQDRPGTYLTYLGYILLTLGMIFTFFVKGSRVHLVGKKLGRLKQASLYLALLFTPGLAMAQDQPLIAGSVVPLEKANAYGTLVVQDLDGRMKPLNTLANEITRKLSGKTSITIPLGTEDLRLSSEQFLLAVQLQPALYSSLPLIKIDAKKSIEAFKVLGKEPQDKLSFRDFLGEDGAYILHDLVEKANQLKPSERNEAHNELLKTDERFNIFYALLTGDFLRLFPNRLDKNNTWFTSQQHQQGFDEEDALFVKNISALYLAGLDKGIKDGDWLDADETLAYIQLFQQKAGAAVYPAAELLEAELLYNQLNLGNRLFGFFWLLGILMLVLSISLLFRQRKATLRLWSIGRILGWVGFAIFTFHLLLRWYIAKHPPWSDGFEMLVFVAWGILLFGLLFSGKSRFTLPLGLLFSGTLLFVSFLDWLNPEITNLMPVLHSYWLKIHVAVIVSSYAPLALAAIIALLSLFLLIFKPSAPTQQWRNSLQELQLVNETSITIGLFLLTIGTFLGGVWANESWGRYWAWDPKETWALISIMVYAFVLHLRLIPSLKNPLVFNLASLWAFSSIIMTSFGVNYYLSGLHSYAKGDPVPVPQWVYWAVLFLLTVSIVAVIKYRSASVQEKKVYAT